jgi:NTP pyrophosphatase (non-canonical NTP hydrolase)
MKRTLESTARSTRHFNGLTESEHERLAILAEECGEVIQAIGKIMRHGYESGASHKDGEVNRHALERELADVLWIVGRMERSGDVNPIAIAEMATSKQARARLYLHHQGGE